MRSLFCLILYLIIGIIGVSALTVQVTITVDSVTNPLLSGALGVDGESQYCMDFAYDIFRIYEQDDEIPIYFGGSMLRPNHEYVGTFVANPLKAYYVQMAFSGYVRNPDLNVSVGFCDVVDSDKIYYRLLAYDDGCSGFINCPGYDHGGRHQLLRGFEVPLVYEIRVSNS